jgi:hypothetical protein
MSPDRRSCCAEEVFNETKGHITNLTRWYRQHANHRGRRAQSFSAQAQAVSFLLTGHEVKAQRTTKQEARERERGRKIEREKTNSPSLPFYSSYPPGGNLQALPDCRGREKLVFLLVTDGQYTCKPERKQCWVGGRLTMSIEHALL